MPLASATPLERTLARLDELDAWFSCVASPSAAPAVAGAAWVRLDELLTRPERLASWVDELTAGQAGGHRDVAVSYLSGWLANALVRPAVTALLTEHRTWPVVPGRLSLRRHPGGWFDALAVEGATVRVLPDDREAAHGAVEVHGDLDGLAATLAHEAVAVLGPLFEVLRTQGPYGRRGMWGSAADAVATATCDLARAGGARSAGAAGSLLDVVLDRLSDAAPGALTRPRVIEVRWSGGAAPFAVRGTCCLYYKVSGLPRHPCSDAYCVTCPLRDPTDRDAHLVAQLEAGAP